MDGPRERPVTPDGEIDRTGRNRQVAGFEASDRPREKHTGLDDDDAPEGGVDTDEFPGAGAP